MIGLEIMLRHHIIAFCWFEYFAPAVGPPPHGGRQQLSFSSSLQFPSLLSGHDHRENEAKNYWKTSVITSFMTLKENSCRRSSRRNVGSGPKKVMSGKKPSSLFFQVIWSLWAILRQNAFTAVEQPELQIYFVFSKSSTFESSMAVKYIAFSTFDFTPSPTAEDYMLSWERSKTSTKTLIKSLLGTWGVNKEWATRPPLRKKGEKPSETLENLLDLMVTWLTFCSSKSLSSHKFLVKISSAIFLSQ